MAKNQPSARLTFSLSAVVEDNIAVKAVAEYANLRSPKDVVDIWTSSILKTEKMREVGETREESQDNRVVRFTHSTVRQHLTSKELPDEKEI